MILRMMNSFDIFFHPDPVETYLGGFHAVQNIFFLRRRQGDTELMGLDS